MSRQKDLDNHANQLNPEHPEYWHSREGGVLSDHEDNGDGKGRSSVDMKRFDFISVQIPRAHSG